MTEEASRRMNILWIMADQMRGDCLGCMGHPIVRTPALDTLASEGVLFRNAYSQYALCTPSRACFFTSRYAHAHGAWWNGVAAVGDQPLFPEILRAQGYRTGLVGKLHLYPQTESHGFDRKEVHEERLPGELSAYAAFLRRQNPLGPWPRQATTWDPGHPTSARTGICHMPEELEETRWVADRACAYLRERTEEPFFLYASFIRPHSPYNPLPRFAQMYEDAEIQAPPFDRKEWEHLPPRVRAQIESVGWDALGPNDFSAMRQRYYALCSQVDESVGRILACLEAQGLADSTIVVFASDHGDMMGEHGAAGKGHLWDGALHVPLILRDPRRTDWASECSGLVETIDLAPTLLEMIDARIDPRMQGRSVTPALGGPSLSHRDAVFAECAAYTVNRGVHDVLAACQDPNSVSVRTDRWKFIHFPGEPGELHDLDADPGEQHNLFGEPDYQPVVREMFERLLTWRVSTTTSGLSTPEPSNSYFSTLFE
jgi:arylsulfatase